MPKDELLRLLKDNDVRAAVRQIIAEAQPGPSEITEAVERQIRRGHLIRAPLR